MKLKKWLKCYRLLNGLKRCVDTYAQSLLTYRQLRLSRPQLVELSDAYQQQSMTTVEQTMSLPVVRLESYVTSMRSLLKYTPKTHRDALMLEECITKLTQLCEAISATLDTRTVRDVTLLLSVADSIAGPEGLSLVQGADGRRWLCSGPDTQVIDDSMLFLFNDLVIACKKNNASSSSSSSRASTSPSPTSLTSTPPYEMVGMVRRDEAETCAPSVKEGSTPAVMLLSRAGWVWLLVGSNEKETADWLLRLRYWCN